MRYLTRDEYETIPPDRTFDCNMVSGKCVKVMLAGMTMGGVSYVKEVEPVVVEGRETYPSRFAMLGNGMEFFQIPEHSQVDDVLINNVAKGATIFVTYPNGATQKEPYCETRHVWNPIHKAWNLSAKAQDDELAEALKKRLNPSSPYHKYRLR